jgi:hypothetical protein
MKAALLSLAAVSLLAAGASQAQAGVTGLPIGVTPSGIQSPVGDPPIIFSFSDSFGDVATGTLSSTYLGGGDYLATGGTLTVTGPAAGIYSIIPGGPASFSIPGFTVDNVIYPSVDPILDPFGLALTNGSVFLNIWGNSPGNYSFYTFDPVSGTYPVANTGSATATASVIPEPSTIVLASISGLALAGYSLLRRRAV